MKLNTPRRSSEKEIARKTVARFSRGNARLQQGKYLTQEDIDARFVRIRESLERHGF